VPLVVVFLSEKLGEGRGVAGCRQTVDVVGWNHALVTVNRERRSRQR
jgi:hypothetical protein